MQLQEMRNDIDEILECQNNKDFEKLIKSMNCKPCGSNCDSIIFMDTEKMEFKETY